MAVYKPFRAVRPAAARAAQVAALPYDVMSSAEAREMVRGNPYSFLHIDKAEIDLPEGVDLYDDSVYAKARENLERFAAEGTLAQDEAPCFYVYRQIMGDREQTGVVGCASIDDYLHNVIKKHEHTRAEKEADRIRHVDTCDANTGPIFLTCRDSGGLKALLEQEKQAEPVYDFVSGDVRQTVWIAQEPARLASIAEAVRQAGDLYIADGHHRCASAVKVGQMRREKAKNFTGEEAFNFFLSVLFPCEELEIMDYNRVVFDRNGLSVQALLQRLENAFEWERVGEAPCAPQARHTFGMYLGGEWYALRVKAGLVPENDAVRSLDVSVLQEQLLSQVLGIEDPRTDKRIDFVGGIRGLKELERRAGMDGVAFAMYPTSLEELMRIADAGLVMPPKSTWFEPKLLSGLFIHKLSD